MFILFTFLFFNGPMLNGNTAEIPFGIYEIFATDGAYVVRTDDHRVAYFDRDGHLKNSFSIAPLQQEADFLVNTMLLIPESDTIWVSDIKRRHIRIYQQGQFQQSIEDVTALRMHHIDDQVLLCPPQADHPFIWASLDGQKRNSFLISATLNDPQYTSPAWQDFETHVLPDGNLLLAYVWASKALIVQPDGKSPQWIDLPHAENRYGERPVFRAQAGVVFHENAAWFLTCSLKTGSCSGLTRLDLKTSQTQQFSIEGSFRRFGQLVNGQFYTIDFEQQAQIYDHFPFPTATQNQE